MRTRISQAYTTARQRGAALIIVLAFVVLLTGLVFAYFSRTTTDRQLSRASYNDTAADLLARSALDVVVGDFKQEVANDLTAGTTPTNILPARSGNPSFNPPPKSSATPADPIPNLIRRSVRSDSLVAPAVPSRASAVNSETDKSFNGRSISTTRWNSHYLIPAASPYPSPKSGSNFIAPDWVLMTRNGPVAFSSWDSSVADRTSNNYVVGRYAYAVYDEGGLLDINVAAYPYAIAGGATPAPSDIGRKGTVTFADVYGPNATGGSPVTIMSDTAANRFLLFRNYATTASTLLLSAPSVTFSVGGVQSFLTFYVGGSTTATQIGTSQDFTEVNKISSNASTAIRTDQYFATRQELIRFQSNGYSGGVATPDALQYLGTFSRSQNKATWDKTKLPGAKGSNLVFPQRFYMGNLNNIGNTTYFGLSPKTGYSLYDGGTGTARTAIPAITNPATADFFQILNYVLHPEWDAANTSDTNNIATTLAVGAALIDQYDTDAVTTRIDYGGGTVYGMENNPADSNRPPAAPVPPSAYYCLNRPFRNVGDLGYAYKQGSIRSDQTLDFASSTSTATSLDAGLLDFFTYNTASPRAAIVNVNTRQAPVLTAVLSKAFLAESNPAATPLPRGGNSQDAQAAANQIVNKTETAAGSSSSAAVSRADVSRFPSYIASSPFGTTATDEYKETIARALAEVTQTRTWGLLIDLVAQTGHYVPTATSLANFQVDGEKRYWLHVSIDRFDGTIMGQQLEEVFEQ